MCGRLVISNRLQVMSPKAAQGMNASSHELSADERLDIMLRQHEEQRRFSGQLPSPSQPPTQLSPWQTPLLSLPQHGSQMPSTASSTSLVHVGSSIPEGSEVVLVDDHSSLPERGSSSSQVQGDGNVFPGVPSSFMGQSHGASSSHGSTVPSLAMRGPFGGDLTQTTMDASSVHPDPPLPPPADSLVSESFSREEFHEPGVQTCALPISSTGQLFAPSTGQLYAPSTG